jgi:PAS domain S-box-containing protein
MTRILVVEDERIVARDIQNTLERLGYTVTATVPTGEEAVRKAEETRPDLALVDIVLSGAMDGIEAARHIHFVLGIPVVYLTAYTDDERLERARATEPVGYIVKPYTERELLATIEMALHQYLASRQRTEAALRESEERYRGLFERVPVGLYRTTPDGQILDVNPALVEMLGYPDRESLLAVNAADLYVNAEDRQRWRALAEREGVVRDFEAQFRRRDGTVIWGRDSARTVRDADGRVVYHEGSLRDITEYKRAEEALRREKDFAESLIETAQAIVLVLDTEGRIVRFNPYLEEISGYRLPEVQGEDWFATFLPERNHSRIRELFSKAIGDIQTRGNINPIVTKDGRERQIEWYDKTLKDAEGNVVGLLSIGQDITERKQAEEQILRQSAVLEAINEVFQETLVCESDEEVARTCLAVAEKLTGSKFGFIGEVNQVGRFDTIAISNPGWDACKMPDSEAARLIKGMEIRGIDRSVIREEKSRIVNDPASHPDRVGTPEGHPSITCFLGVPLKQAGRTKCPSSSIIRTSGLSVFIQKTKNGSWATCKPCCKMARSRRNIASSGQMAWCVGFTPDVTWFAMPAVPQSE